MEVRKPHDIPAELGTRKSFVNVVVGLLPTSDPPQDLSIDSESSVAIPYLESDVNRFLTPDRCH